MPRSTLPAALTTGPFTRRQALAAGLTDRQLQSSACRQVFNGVWVAAAMEDTRDLRLAAARLLLPPTGVLCGLTAAWALDVDVRRLDDLDVHVGFPKGKRIRKRAGLAVCQETLDPGDIADVDGVPVTTPVRTAFDCLRWLRAAEGLVVADALMHAEQVTLEELQRYFRTKHRLRNLRIGERLLDWAEPKSESPMETRLRYLMLDGGLPRPEAQCEVHDRWGNLLGRLDLAYPDQRVAVEYDGAFHWKQRREDDRRRAAIRKVGWDIYVYSADDVFRAPLATLAEIREALRAAAA